MSAAVVFILIVICLVIAIPVSISLGIVAVLPGAFDSSFTASASYVIRSMLGGIDSFPLLAVPMFVLAGIVMVINQKFFISGFKSLWHRAPNMDTLVALGSMASFLWSVYVLFAMTRAQVDGDSAAVMNYMMEFYFESAAMILTLITVG